MKRLTACGLLFAGLCALRLTAAGPLDPALPDYSPEQTVSGGLNSVGDDALKPLMEAWLTAFQKRQPGIVRGEHWLHPGSAAAFGALMFERADVAPLDRAPLPTELAPYAHQFKGDMMKEPLLIRIGSVENAATNNSSPSLAVNRRPGAPLPQIPKEFLSFVLSREGQQIVARSPRYRALNANEAAKERAKLDGYLVSVDRAISSYHVTTPVSGPIANVGSDGMESLMEKWMTAFCHLQPAVHRGAHWSHQGTLNGFHALLAGESDIAAMGRELWPDEQAAFLAIRGQAPLEIRVARGGFNTPQRTTAQAIFVNERNPLAGLTLPQLDAIFGRERRRGIPTGITRWGQLGLTGEWADRAITVYVPYRVSPNAMSLQMSVLKGGAWNSEIHEGSIAEVAAAVAREPGAIAFGGFEEGGPGLRTVAVAARDGGEFIAGNAANAASGRYPLTRYMYIRLNRETGRPIAPQVREFLRFILSREGQEIIPTSAYFPLRADEVAVELAKLG